MRTIKFRGKRIDNGEWVIGQLVKMWEEWHILNSDNVNTAYPVDPATVGQYTGLNDTNSREIYEGDIFQAGYFGGMDVVMWDNENTRYIGRSPQGCISYVGREPAVKIIGNIHDNPELLKGGER
ncbi:YopX family protein [uncultured Alistipes sp.]|uniref:YopX family protein n=1 Tax=uncultured Alistipes sp. TaxID=538949 RepID=UPI00266DA698|nr:YopX family protein [uncultured Alistipes sp.]